jgi:hypothetical protein
MEIKFNAPFALHSTYVLRFARASTAYFPKKEEQRKLNGSPCYSSNKQKLQKAESNHTLTGWKK